MTLEDFEKSLAEDREKRHHSKSGRHHRDNNDRHHHHHRHSHRRHSSRSRERESRHRDSQHDENGHRSKRSRRDSLDNDDGHDNRAYKRRHGRGESNDRGGGQVEEISRDTLVVQDERKPLKRDAWMEGPSAFDVDYMHMRNNARLQEEPKPKMLQADYELKLHDREINEHLRDVRDGAAMEDLEVEPASHDVDYTFGDAGSQWRMTKLRAVNREAEESGRPVEDIAIDRFGDLRSYDDSREEETELDRRERLGPGYVGKIKPSGELFEQRKLDEGVVRQDVPHNLAEEPVNELRSTRQRQPMETERPQATTMHLDITALNRLKAQMMKAKLKGAPDASELEARYNAEAAEMANRKESDVVVLGVMENRMLAGDRSEVKPVENRRGRERGRVEENDDMSIEDMVREERRTRGQPGGAGERLAERIAKDSRFEVSCGELYFSLSFQCCCHVGLQFQRMTWSTWMTMRANWLSAYTGPRSTSRMQLSTNSKR